MTWLTVADGSRLCELLHPLCTSGLPMRCSIAVAELQPKQANALHRLRESTEIFYILSGTGTIRIDDELQPVVSGDAVVVPPGAWQCLENNGTELLRFLCICDPAWHADDEEVEQPHPKSGVFE